MLTKDTEVDYDDSTHRYSLLGQKYTSASQLVERFTEPFDTVEVAKRYALKHGETAEYWIAKWKEKNDKSKVRGNFIHDANEVALHGRMVDIFNSQQLPVQGEHTDQIPWIERPDGVYTERKLWHHGYKIAGRADKIILLTNRDPDNIGIYNITERYAHIEDYKTNESLNFESYQFKNGTHKVMRPPIAYLPDCNWIHYCLQLSTYMLMLEYQGFLPGTMTITHFPHPTEECPNPTKQKYNVPYMKKEVVLMCNFINR
jgi:hypothetical protein